MGVFRHMREGQGDSKKSRSCLLLIHIKATEGHDKGKRRVSRCNRPASGLVKFPDWRASWAVSAVVIASSCKQP